MDIGKTSFVDVQCIQLTQCGDFSVIITMEIKHSYKYRSLLNNTTLSAMYYYHAHGRVMVRHYVTGWKVTSSRPNKGN
jgi:hypothetical protein